MRGGGATISDPIRSDPIRRSEAPGAGAHSALRARSVKRALRRAPFPSVRQSVNRRCSRLGGGSSAPGLLAAHPCLSVCRSPAGIRVLPCRRSVRYPPCFSVTLLLCDCDASLWRALLRGCSAVAATGPDGGQQREGREEQTVRPQHDDDTTRRSKQRSMEGEGRKDGGNGRGDQMDVVGRISISERADSPSLSDWPAVQIIFSTSTTLDGRDTGRLAP